MKVHFWVPEAAADNIPVTLQITMTLSQWKHLRDATDDKWPGWDFKGKITDVVNQAEKVFSPEAKVVKE